MYVSTYISKCPKIQIQFICMYTIAYALIPLFLKQKILVSNNEYITLACLVSKTI